MSYNGSGVFTINTAGQPVVTGTTISSTTFNNLTADLATGLTTALAKDGQSTPTANIGLGTYKIVNLGAGTVASDAARLDQVQGGAATFITVAGTDTLTGTVFPALSAYAAGNQFSFLVANTNTGAVTINVDGIGAKAITRTGTTALVAGDMVAGQAVEIIYDGTRFQLVNGNSFTNLKVSGTLGVTGAATFTAQPIVSSLTASLPVFTDASKGLVSNTMTGTGNVVMSTSPTLVTPALGTPSALVGTNITGTAAGLTAGTVTTNANLTGPITSVGNATSIASQTGTGTKFVMDTSPTITGATLTTAALNGTLGATTPSTVEATSVNASLASTFKNTFTNWASNSSAYTTGNIVLRDAAGTNPVGLLTTGGVLYLGKDTATDFANFSSTGLVVTGNLSATTTGKVGTTIGVGAATPSASGAGITFPATQSASSDANTLDDYEEGTWTPTFGCTTTNPTYTATSAAGKYTKVGNVVYYSFYLYSSGGATGGSGSVIVSGLPFTAGYTAVRGLPTYLFWGGVNKWTADGRNGLGWGASNTDAFLSLYASSAVYANGVFEIGGTGFYYVT